MLRHGTEGCVARVRHPVPPAAGYEVGVFRPPGVSDFFGRALQLAERGRGKVGRHPLVGAVVVSEAQIVGEGWYEYERIEHAESVALGLAGGRARGADLYVTLEPCSHYGRTPPCVDAILAAGVRRVVIGALDPNPVAAGGAAQLRAAGVEVEVLDSFEARQQNEAWRTWKELARPFVTYKVAISLDGRVVVPGRRWVSGEESRRLVHELRAASDAVAVGMGTVRADAPRLDARHVPVRVQPRRLAFGGGPLPATSTLELRSGPLGEELRELAVEGVMSILLEGGPTVGCAFLEEGLVDKLLVFVAPVLAGGGPRFVEQLSAPVELLYVRASSVGPDVLIEGYIHAP
jgi:diaminohydroxyphosphoribosylaminopyrimidine deaminase/5-amino-6-(5-phosphoribosylamino)uracil reductase